MFRFASLGSGSKGNATLIQVNDTMVMVDCGFTIKETEARLLRLDVSPEHINAILVTHEHSDHLGGVAPFSRKHDIPVWLTHGTLHKAKDDGFYEAHCFNAHEAFAINDMAIQPYPVPHDAREPSQFVFSNGEKTLGLLTDCGSITPHIISMLDGVHALLLECNYEERMLLNGPYPPSLKARVGSSVGHLSNAQAEHLLQSINTEELFCLIGMHVSENNNAEAHAYEALTRGLGHAPSWLEIACQNQGFDWKTVA